MDKIEVYIVDNQNLTRIGTIEILNKFYQSHIRFTEINTWNSLLNEIKLKHPQLIIIDFELIDLSNILELTDLKKASPTAGIIILTDNKNPNDVTRVINQGFTTYLLKSCTENELTEACAATLQNKKYFSPEILDIIIDQRSKQNNTHEGKLTQSEIEIVKLIAQGLTTKEIADKRNLSFHTVITHRKNIFKKLGINNTSELMMYAMRNGLIDSLEYYI